jgi:hypothetical protein
MCRSITKNCHNSEKSSISYKLKLNFKVEKKLGRKKINVFIYKRHKMNLTRLIQLLEKIYLSSKRSWVKLTRTLTEITVTY